MRFATNNQRVRTGRWWLLLTAALICSLSAWGQTAGRQIRGLVTDDSGLPVIGAGVLLSGTNSGTTTGPDGRFVLDLKNEGDVRLDISSLGYHDKTVSVPAAQSEITIVIEEDVTHLDDVVVVAYGKQKRASLTGAISSVSSDAIKETRNENVVNSLAGKMAGVRVVQTSGEPGSFASTISIRGMGAPLVIIDGVPRDNMERLDPNEIESISTLKDASAAIYGMRASNGVILITTKRGKEGASHIQYEGYAGFSMPINTPDGLNAWQFMEITNENNIMRGSMEPGIFIYSPSEIEKYKNGLKDGTEWWRINNNKYSPQTSHNLSISGGTNKVQYFANVAYMGQQGIYSTGDLNYNRFNLRSNISAEVAPGLKADLLLSGMMDTKNSPYYDTEIFYRAAWVERPVDAAFANYTRPYMANIAQGYNPLAITDSDISGYKRLHQRLFQATGALTWQIPWIKGLEAKVSYSYDYTNWDGKDLKRSYTLYTYSLDTNEFIPSVYGGKDDQPELNSIRRSTRFSQNNLFQGSINFDRTFGRHHIAALALYEEQTVDMDNYYAQRFIEMTSLGELSNGISDGQIGSMDQSYYTSGVRPADQSGLWQIASKSVVGRLNYDFAERYYAEAAFRYDGSSKFAKGHQWGFFPSVSAGWRISEEPWMQSARGWLNNLKIRASWGEAGDDSTANFQYVEGFEYGSGSIDWWPLLWDGKEVNIIRILATPNESLTWIRTRTANIGIDADLWNGRFGFEFDIFQRDRSGKPATRNVTIPDWLGQSLAQENLNSDRTRGFDLTLRHRNHFGDFYYGLTGNMAFSRMMNIYVEHTDYGTKYLDWRNNASNRFNDIWWGYDYAGQFQNYEQIWNWPVMDALGNSELKPGDYSYYDWNEDGVIDDNDIHPIAYGAQTTPVLYYGMTLDFQWKGIDLTAVFQGGALNSVKYDWYLSTPFIYDKNGPDFFYDRWHMADPAADPKDPRTEWIPGYLPTTSQGSTAMNLNVSNSRASIKDASYLRLKSLEIGYTFPEKWMKTAGIESLRVFANAYNLLTFTGLKYLDPEHPSSGYGTTYPLIMTVNFGVNINF
ncbi:MAG: TonB-dependent receptor [Bacteroidales bacterium]|nr:TonB-dependent receptor [Bacteroidales bacterium]